MPDTALKIWVGIPAGSRLEVSIESASTQWGSDAHLVIAHPGGTQDEQDWSHDELHPGPRTLVLEGGNGYTVGVRVSFTGSVPVNATIRARVVKPDGSVYGSAYAYTVSGTAIEVARSSIIAVTKRSGGSP
jgi:hypothetical protein